MSARCAPVLAVALAGALGAVALAQVQIKARVPSGVAKPAWDKGIQPISRDSYYNAIECGKQKGARPLCVFPDADLCKNDDYTLALFTPYKQVAYEVWQTVSHGGDAPTPSYAAAQRTRITVGVTVASAAKNPLTALAIRRGGKAINPATQSFESGGGKFIFDFDAFAPTAPITIEMTGRMRTVSCTLEPAVLRFLR